MLVCDTPCNAPNLKSNYKNNKLKREAHEFNGSVGDHRLECLYGCIWPLNAHIHFGYYSDDDGTLAAPAPLIRRLITDFLQFKPFSLLRCVCVRQLLLISKFSFYWSTSTEVYRFHPESTAQFFDVFSAVAPSFAGERWPIPFPFQRVSACQAIAGVETGAAWVKSFSN